MADHKLADGRTVVVDRVAPAAKRYNVYACDNGHHNLSMDLDEGVTPMFLMCRRDGCGARSVSSGYPAGDPPEHLFPVRVIWRKATKGEMKRERRKGGEHFALGGLQMEWVSR